MHKFISFFLILAALLSLNGLVVAEQSKIIILHVNDPHAKIDNYPKIAWYVAQQRKAHTHVFFFNSGDNFSGNPVVDLAQPKGEPVRVLMNHMGYDVMTIGNHDFDYGQEVTKNFISKAKFPVLGANIHVHSGPIPQPKPYVILKTKNNINVAVLGLIQKDEETGIPSTMPAGVKGISFSDPIETAKKFRHLKNESNVFIALTHLGVERDIRLAEEMGELDVIIGGHSHTRLPKTRIVNNVMIAQAGSNAGFVGRIELTFEDGKLVRKFGTLIDVKTIKEEIPQLKQMVARYNDNPVLEEVVATIPYAPSGKFRLGHLITDGIRKIQNLDIAFHNSGGIRSNILNTTVKRKDIYTIHPFGNVILRFQMTPAEIRSLITYDFERQKYLDLKVSGLRYLIKRTLDFKVKEILLYTPDGKPLDETRTYSVGINSYMASSFKFDHKDSGKELMVTLAQNLTRYLEKYKNVLDGIDELRTFQTIVEDKTKTPIGKTLVELSSGEVVNPGSVSSGNLVCDSIRQRLNVDIVFYPHFLLQTGLSLPAGANLYEEYVTQFFRYSDKSFMVTADIKGSDLIQFILDRCRYRSGVDVQVSGMTYTLNFDQQGQVRSVECLEPDGKPVSADKVYKVAFNQYEFNRQYNLGDKAFNLHTGKESIADMVIAYIKKKGTLDRSISEKRIQLKH